jgi:hypothetical protein
MLSMIARSEINIFPKEPHAFYGQDASPLGMLLTTCFLLEILFHYFVLIPHRKESTLLSFPDLS